MFFSRIRLSSINLDFRSSFGISRLNVYGSHRLLWELFPDDSQARRDFLFRQEFEHEQVSVYQSRQKGRPIFYMVSKRRPAQTDLLQVEVKEYHPVIQEGEHFYFELRANPVISKYDDSSNRSKKHDVLMNAKKAAKEKGNTLSQINLAKEAAAKLWLLKKSKINGFALEERTVETGRYHLHRFFKKGSSAVSFSSIDFQGMLHVTNTDLFRKVLFEGLGRSKSFGCGMMMIRRIINH